MSDLLEVWQMLSKWLISDRGNKSHYYFYVARNTIFLSLISTPHTHTIMLIIMEKNVTMFYYII